MASGNPPPPPRLIIRERFEGVPAEFVLKPDQTTLGRHPSNDIVLGLDSISRFHARIDRRGDFFIVQDLNSSNGTAVNGERVTQMAIHDGDVVTFGNIDFKFANEAAKVGLGTSSVMGRDIIDFEDDDDQDSRPSGTKSVITAEEVERGKSSVISTSDKKADKATLFKLNQRLSALYRLSEMLRESDTDDEPAVLQRVLDIVFIAVHADRGVILTRFNAMSEELDVTAVKYRDEPIVPQKVKVSRTIVRQVLSDRVAVLSQDAQFDDRFAASESIFINQIRSTICAPMIVGEEVIGVVHLDTTEKGKAFEQEDLEFVMMIATEVGVALAHARMRREANHRARLAAVGETVAGISHNVKNILLLSEGGSELLTRAMNKGDMAGAKEAWQVVSRGIDKIGKLVRDMLEFSSQKKVDLGEADINELICAIAEEIEEQLISKGITLELDLDENLEPRMVDELGLQRTVTNLIVNSMEAIGHQDGQISVATARRSDGRAVITIRDNGSGIPKDKMEKIFLPFFTTKGSSGTGLGLPMCKKCIEDMGGRIQCESEENVGTTFILDIPQIGKQ